MTEAQSSSRRLFAAAQPIGVTRDYPRLTCNRSGQLEQGDEVVSVDGQDVASTNPNGVRSLIVGEEGTGVRIGAKRNGQFFEVHLNRLSSGLLSIQEPLSEAPNSGSLVSGRAQFAGVQSSPPPPAAQFAPPSQPAVPPTIQPTSQPTSQPMLQPTSQPALQSAPQPAPDLTQVYSRPQPNPISQPYPPPQQAYPEPQPSHNPYIQPSQPTSYNGQPYPQPASGHYAPPTAPRPEPSPQPPTLQEPARLEAMGTSPEGPRPVQAPSSARRVEELSLGWRATGDDDAAEAAMEAATETRLSSSLRRRGQVDSATEAMQDAQRLLAQARAERLAEQMAVRSHETDCDDNALNSSRNNGSGRRDLSRQLAGDRDTTDRDRRLFDASDFATPGAGTQGALSPSAQRLLTSLGVSGATGDDVDKMDGMSALIRDMRERFSRALAAQVQLTREAETQRDAAMRRAENTAGKAIAVVDSSEVGAGHLQARVSELEDELALSRAEVRRLELRLDEQQANETEQRANTMLRLESEIQEAVTKGQESNKLALRRAEVALTQAEGDRARLQAQVATLSQQLATSEARSANFREREEELLREVEMARSRANAAAGVTSGGPSNEVLMLKGEMESERSRRREAEARAERLLKELQRRVADGPGSMGGGANMGMGGGNMGGSMASPQVDHSMSANTSGLGFTAAAVDASLAHALGIPTDHSTSSPIHNHSGSPNSCGGARVETTAAVRQAVEMRGAWRGGQGGHHHPTQSPAPTLPSIDQHTPPSSEAIRSISAAINKSRLSGADQVQQSLDVIQRHTELSPGDMI